MFTQLQLSSVLDLGNSRQEPEAITATRIVGNDLNQTMFFCYLLHVRRVYRI